jgi:formate/nitrite transporter FocA (FNT family)
VHRPPPAPGLAEDHPASAHAVLEQEPHEIADRATAAGTRRLERSPWETFLTACIGGLEVSLGGLAAMTVTGAALAAVPGLPFYSALAVGGLAFPIGFLLVLVGRSELFTENFLIPVASVVRGRRAAGELLRLWALSWVGNILGCAGLALLLLVPEAVGESIRDGYRAYSAVKLAMPLPGLFVSAVLAGMTMTSLTWLLLSLRHAVGRVLAIFAVGYLLFAANLSHSIVGAAVIFAGFQAAGFGPLDVLRWVLVATVGNLVGGLLLVTLLRYGQVREQRERMDEQDEDHDAPDVARRWPPRR